MPETRLLDYDSTATLLSCSAAKVKKMVLAGELPHVKLGNLTRIPLAAIDAWIERHTVKEITLAVGESVGTTGREVRR